MLAGTFASGCTGGNIAMDQGIHALDPADCQAIVI